MHLAEVFLPEMFWPNLSSKTKHEIIKELSDRIALVHTELDPVEIAKILMEREKLGSTGIQDGIAIPHGKVPGIESVIVACGTSDLGVDFESHDQKPTNIFFVLLAPEFAAGQHLKILARLSRLLKEQNIREGLLSLDDGKKMCEYMIEEDAKI